METSVPAGCVLDFAAGAKLRITAGGGLQIRGTIRADSTQQIFSALVSASAIHGYGSQQVSVKWFGAKGDGATNDNDAFEQVSRFAATAQSITVRVPRGTYVVGKEGERTIRFGRSA